MTAQQEASVADERVEAIAQIIEEEAIDLTAGSGEIEGVGRMSRRAAIKIAALWPAPAEDEVEAAALALLHATCDHYGDPRPVNPDLTFTRILARAALSIRQPKPEDDILAWAVERWNAEVANRPLQNIHRRTLDDTWRQVIRHCGGDDVALCGPAHDDLLANASASPATRPAHAAEVADAAVRRCIATIETKTSVREGLDEYDAGYRLGVMCATEVLRALLTSEPSND